MQLSISEELASRILRFQDSPQFSLETAEDAYSPYWLHHREQIRTSIGQDRRRDEALLDVEGDSGFYVPRSSSTRDRLGGARRFVSRLRSATKSWAIQISPEGPYEPINVPFARAFDICQEHMERQGHLDQTSIGLPATSKGVATEFTEWSGRVPNDHVMLAYHLLRLTCCFGGLPGPNGTVLEVGAGSGNLASLIKHYFPAKRIVIVDLPETIQLSVGYLGSVFPEASCVLPNEVDSGDLDQCDFLFLTPDQIQFIPDESVALSINMHSFQEMTAEPIATYFELFERVLTRGGHSLVVNRVE